MKKALVEKWTMSDSIWGLYFTDTGTFGAPGSARTRGLSLWIFREGRRAHAQKKSDAARRLPAKPRSGAHVAPQRCTTLRCE